MDMKDHTALKDAIRGRMMQMEASELATAVEHYGRFLGESVLDDREGHDNSEIAEARESADLAAAFDAPVHTHQARLDAIEGIDFSPTDTVRPGAIVAFNNRHFVVAVATSRFECKGTEYMGISTQSPIYRAIEGLGAGDEFTYNGRSYTLDEVF